MSDAAAGQFYLTNICISNRASTALNTAMGASDYSALQSAAVAARDTASKVAGIFDKALWPDDVKEDAATVSAGLFAQASYEDDIAKAGSMEAFYAIQTPDFSAFSTASQRIRSRLNLPADTAAGC